VVILNPPLVIRIFLYYAMRHRHPPQAASLPGGGARTVLMFVFAILLPLIIFGQVPLAVGFALSRLSMNKIHQSAVLHPGGHLPAQRMGLYWAEDITATATGVHFRVYGWPGRYGSRSGFSSGNINPTAELEEEWSTSDPL